MVTAIDWGRTSVEDRRNLYLSVKRLEDSGLITRQQFYERVFGDDHRRLGPGFQNNFSTGRVSARNASLIYNFVASHFPESAKALASSISPPPLRGPLSPWLEFLEENAVHFELGSRDLFRFARVALSEDGRWVRPPPLESANDHYQIARGQSYAVLLDSPQSGWATALYEVDGFWFRFGWQDYVQKIRAGPQWLSNTSDGAQVQTLSIHEHGNFKFVVLFSKSKVILTKVTGLMRHTQALRESELNEIARSLAASNARLVVVSIGGWVYIDDV